MPYLRLASGLGGRFRSGAFCCALLAMAPAFVTGSPLTPDPPSAESPDENTGCSAFHSASPASPGIMEGFGQWDPIINTTGMSPLRENGALLPFEHIDPFSGNLLLTFTDVVLPGDGGFDLRIQRTYNSHFAHDYYSYLPINEDSWAGVGWTLHLGRVIQTVTRPIIEMPDGSRHPVYTVAGSWADAITRDYWRYHDPTGPTMPTLELTNGLVYTFGHVGNPTIEGWPMLYVTRIDDPFGNRIDIEYMSDDPQTPNAPLDAIKRIDHQGRFVEFGYLENSGHKQLRWMRVNAGGQQHTWWYDQISLTQHQACPQTLLTKVTPPIGPGWTFDYYTAGSTPSYELNYLKTPYGGTINYTFNALEIGYCSLCCGANQPIPTRGVTSRVTGGRDVPPGTWTFLYNQGIYKDYTAVQAPCGTVEYRFYGVGGDNGICLPEQIPLLAYKIGAQINKAVKDDGDLIENEETIWTPSDQISPDQEIIGPYPPYSGIRLPLLDQRKVKRKWPNGTTFLTDFDYHWAAQGYILNDYGRPYLIKESGDLLRTTTRTFDYDFSPYIRDKVKREEIEVGNNGDIYARNWEYSNSTGFLTSQNIYGVAKTFGPYLDGNVEWEEDALLNRTTFTYDWGVLENTTTPEGFTIERTINPQGTVQAETRRGFTWDFSYDSLFRPLDAIPPPVVPGIDEAPMNQTGTAYDNNEGIPTEIEWVTVTRGTSWTRTDLDGFGRPSGTENAMGVKTDVDYDACGRKSYESLPYASSNIGTSFTYDSLSRLTRKDNPDGTFMTYDYLTGADGIDVDIRDEMTPPRLTHQNWRAFGDPQDARLTAVTDALNKTWSYDYHPLGGLAKVTPPNNTPIRQWFYYGPADTPVSGGTPGLLKTESQPEGAPIQYTYHANGLLKSRADGSGSAQYLYDTNGRLKTINREPGATSYDVSLDYDDSDNRTLSQTGQPGGATYIKNDFTFDRGNRLTSRIDLISGTFFETSYTPDGNDNLAELEYPSGLNVVYQYDNANRVTKVRKPNATCPGADCFAEFTQYHPSGAPLSFRTGNDEIHNFEYYANTYRPWKFKIGNTPYLTYSLYDAAGNLKTVDDSQLGVLSFSYDNVNRLTTFNGPWGSGSSIQYVQSGTGNGTGDRFSKTVIGSGSTNYYNYNSSTGRLTSVTGGPEAGTFGYDNAGNLTSSAMELGGTYTYGYTPSNMLETVFYGNWTTTYRYGADDLRKMSFMPSTGATRYYVHGPGDQLLSEFRNNGAGVTPVRDYIYAGKTAIGHVRYPSPTTVSMGNLAESVNESGRTITLLAHVITEDNLPLASEVTVDYATIDDTTTAGLDYEPLAGTLTFPVGTPNGGNLTVDVQILNDDSDESNETFRFVLSDPTGATLGLYPEETVTIVDNDPVEIRINDVTANEGPPGQATFLVELTTPAIQPFTVNYQTVNGTAIAPGDYTSKTGTLAFWPGYESLPISVPIVDDNSDEDDETFRVVLTDLSDPVNATIKDGDGTATINDNDPPPVLTISDGSGPEGNCNGGSVGFNITISPPSGKTVGVQYTTVPGTATEGVDYVPISAYTSAGPGIPNLGLSVNLIGDFAVEPNETFVVDLSNPVNGSLPADHQGDGTILNDDAGPSTAMELVHGSTELQNLGSGPAGTGIDFFRLAQKPYSSYEIVIDATSGRIGDVPPGVLLQRVSCVLPAIILQDSLPIGSGYSRSLRWQNTSGTPVVNELIQVKSSSCSSDCLRSDVYRIRAYDTTGSISYFSTVTGQATVLLIQNRGTDTVSGRAYFWNPVGGLLGSHLFTLQPKQVLTLDAASVAGVAGQSGSITVTHDGRFGDLVGKATTVETSPSTGYSYDTEMVPRSR